MVRRQGEDHLRTATRFTPDLEGTVYGLRHLPYEGKAQSDAPSRMFLPVRKKGIQGALQRFSVHPLSVVPEVDMNGRPTSRLNPLFQIQIDNPRPRLYGVLDEVQQILRNGVMQLTPPGVLREFPGDRLWRAFRTPRH